VRRLLPGTASCYGLQAWTSCTTICSWRNAERWFDFAKHFQSGIKVIPYTLDTPRLTYSIHRAKNIMKMKESPMPQGVWSEKSNDATLGKTFGKVRKERGMLMVQRSTGNITRTSWWRGVNIS
jgi:hypothetical protein